MGTNMNELRLGGQWHLEYGKAQQKCWMCSKAAYTLFVCSVPDAWYDEHSSVVDI